jgi:predicted nucleic acid-binding protein
MVFLDSSIVIYYVEQPATWGPKASDRLTALQASGEQFAVTELVRMECLVGPIKAGDAAMLADFAAFFSASDVVILPITAPIAERAAEIRATYQFGPMDSFHLAAAVDSGCNLFLTNDTQLRQFVGVVVEVLT